MAASNHCLSAHVNSMTGSFASTSKFIDAPLLDEVLEHWIELIHFLMLNFGSIMSNIWKITRLLQLAIASSIFVTVPPVVAQFTGPGGIQTQTGKATVASIKKNPINDMDVVLQGNLLKKVAHEKYTFSDGTGEITVEIDDEDFGGKQINPKTKIEIHGEVEVRGSWVQIDVGWFRIL